MGELSGASLGKGTAHPICSHQLSHLVMWPHLTILGPSCVPKKHEGFVCVLPREFVSPSIPA